MNRHAVIISNPGESGQENYCAGVLRDVQNYRSFLLSPVGGSWREPEISSMGRPSAADVRSEARTWRTYDYVLAVFSGHGCTKQGSTWIELREGYEIDSNDLRLSTTKQTIILDCCRRPVEPARMRALDEKVAKKAAPTLHAADCRKYYDERIEECPTELVVMYACSVGELAGDDSQRGGTYSYSLLQASRAWAGDSTTDTSEKYNILSVVRAHEGAATLVSSVRPQQTPQIEKPRTGPYYPFCIVA
jgi:hypothetical protein